MPFARPGHANANARTHDILGYNDFFADIIQTLGSGLPSIFGLHSSQNVASFFTAVAYRYSCDGNIIQFYLSPKDLSEKVSGISLTRHVIHLDDAGSAQLAHLETR